MSRKAHHDSLKGLSPDALRRLKESVLRKSLTGHALLAEGLKQIGIRRLFGVTGLPVNEVFGEAAKRGIRIIGNRGQFGATLMAGAANYADGALGSAVCVSAGPAVTQSVTGLYFARDNQWPLIVLGGRHTISGKGRGYFQEFDAVPLMSPVTKWAATVREPGDIIPMLVKAREISQEGVPGPVYLDVPDDVLMKSAPAGQPDIKSAETGGGTLFSEESLRAAVEILERAERPLLCLGEGLRWGWNAEVLKRLIGDLCIPFVTTPMGRGLVSEDHPSCLNAGRRQALHRADVIVLAGAALDWRFRMGNELSPDCRLIHVDPDKRNLGPNRTSAWEACGNPMAFLTALAEILPAGYRPKHVWLAEAERHRLREERETPPSANSGKPYVDPVIFLRRIREWISRDAIIVAEGGTCLSLVQHGLRAHQPFSMLDPGLNGCIGSGLPLAIGTRLALPERPVYAFVGDTGFGMSGFELETAVRHRAPIKVVVFNNSGIFGQQRQHTFLGESYPERFSQYQENIRYDQVALALGCDGFSSDDTDTAIEQFRLMTESPLPGVLNLVVHPDLPRPDVW